MSHPKTVLITKAGYRQAGYSRGLMLIHLALDTVLRERLPGVPVQLKLTAGSNGTHSAKGPHYAPRFESCDVESKPITGLLSKSGAVTEAGGNKRGFLEAVMGELGEIILYREGDTKVFTKDYFGWLEAEGTPNEHYHFQVRKNRTIRD